MSKTIGVSLFALMIAGSAQAQQVGDVFYIALENHNFTQPSSLTDPEQILGNAAAPYINSLVTPGNPNAAQTSYASMYLNAAVGLHPSEPNYVWQEAGLHGPLNDADPYPNNIVNAPNLSGLLQAKYGTSGWRSYQEDTDLLNTSGQNFNSAAGTLTNNVASPSQYEVPLTSFSGTSADYTKPTTAATSTITRRSTIRKYFSPTPTAGTTRPRATPRRSITRHCSSCRPTSTTTRWRATTGSLPISTTICIRRCRAASPITACITPETRRRSPRATIS